MTYIPLFVEGNLIQGNNNNCFRHGETKLAKFPFMACGCEVSEVDPTSLMQRFGMAADEFSAFSGIGIAPEVSQVVIFLESVLETVSKPDPIYACVCDDGSILLEYIQENWRLGFSIEPQGSSSWSLVTDETHNHMWLSGYLWDLPMYLDQVVDFVKARA